MAYMPDTRPDAPRYLREQDASTADATVTVDVRDLVARLAERTEQVAEAMVRRKHAEAKLKKKTREMDKEREAHGETIRQLEADCREREEDCYQVAAEYRELEAQVAREREARAAVQTDLKRAQDRVAALQHQLQGAWAQLQPGETESEKRPWWGRTES
jgi:chromosome segregation ATPase